MLKDRFIIILKLQVKEGFLTCHFFKKKSEVVKKQFNTPKEQLWEVQASVRFFIFKKRAATTLENIMSHDRFGIYYAPGNMER